MSIAVLNSFNNSKLRFLETQVLLNQYSGSLHPRLPADGAIPTAARGLAPRCRSSAAPAVCTRRRDSPAQKIGIGALQGERAAGGADLETNMEMVIYGIVTLSRVSRPAPRWQPPPPQAPHRPGSEEVTIANRRAVLRKQPGCG